MGNPKVTLSAPVIFNGETFAELTFREPEVGDLIDAEDAGGGMQKMTFALLASCCGMPFDAFRKIKARDIARIMNATSGILKNVLDSAEAGETSLS